MTFEERFQQLEQIIVRLERGELTLDESLVEYEKGVGALRACRDLLGKAEKRIEELAHVERELAAARRPEAQPASPAREPAGRPE